MSLPYISQQMTIYGGIVLIIIGYIGNLINVLVFSTSQNYRRIPCAFYFLTSAICNIIYISTNFISRIVTQIDGYDFTRISSIWCKIRNFCIFTFTLMTLSSTCLATIDQYLASSQSVRVRQLSNMKSAYRIMSIITIICILHGIISILFIDISPITRTCGSISAGYSIYNIVYLLALITTVPSSIMLIFGYLTYRNIHLTRVLVQQHADRQLIRMIFIQVALDLISMVPYSVASAYLNLTATVQKDSNRQMIESFIFSILTLLTYCYYTVCLFFLINSKLKIV